MVNKKGYMKTVEAIIAVILFFSVVLILVGVYSPEEEATPEDIKTIQNAVLNTIESSPEIRNNIILNQSNALSAELDTIIPNNLNYLFTICDSSFDTCPPPPIDPEKTVYVSSLVISSTYQQYNNTLFRLFLYRKIE